MEIRQKFFCLIGVVGIILAVVSGVGYYIAYSHLSVSIENGLMAIVEKEGLTIDRWLLQKEAVVTGVARQLQHLDASVADSQAVLGAVDGDADGMDLASGTESGLFMSWMDGDVSEEDGDPRVRPWYKEAKAAGKTVFTNVYESATGSSANSLIVSVAAPYNDASGQFRGALCGDIALDKLGKRVEKLKYNGEGQGIIIGKTGAILATAGSEPIMSKISDDPVLKDRAKDVLANKDGYFTVEKDGETQVFAYTTLPASDWMVGIYVPESVVFADVKTMKMTYGILFLAGILLVGFAGIQFSNRITRTVLRLKEHADGLSKGNLQMKDLVVESADELGLLSKNFNTMSHNIRALIQKIAATAEQVAASSEELTASAQQSAEATNNVAGTITQVAGGMENQVRDIGTAKQDVEVVFTDITMVADKTKQVASMTAQTADAAQKGETLMVGAMSTMGSIETSVLDSAELVKKLGENSKQIGQIVDTIAAITDQTNLLALNAAIEAARAGEHGRGFAVVAEEVRKLAAESQESAEEIKNRIEAIQADTEQVVVSMQSGTVEVKRGTEAIHEVGDQFTSIMDMVSAVKEQMDDIETAVQAVTNGATNIVKAVDSIDEVSRVTAEHTQTISAATEEQSASTEEIASASQALAKLATDLQEAIGKFRI